MAEFLKLFFTFFSIGAVTFGGGYAMLLPIKQQVQNNWDYLINSEQIMDFIGISESTPGPFAVNMATYVGSVVGGNQGGVLGSVLGAFCATMGVVLPSFIVILIVAKCYEKFKTNRIVQGCMTGLKPAVVGLIGSAILSMVLTVFFPGGWTISVFYDPSTYVSLAIFAVMLVAAFKKVHPIVIVILSAAIGIVAGYLL